MRSGKTDGIATMMVLRSSGAKPRRRSAEFIPHQRARWRRGWFFTHKVSRIILAAWLNAGLFERGFVGRTLRLLELRALHAPPRAPAPAAGSALAKQSLEIRPLRWLERLCLWFLTA
jgi:hypothetical protein